MKRTYVLVVILAVAGCTGEQQPAERPELTDPATEPLVADTVMARDTLFR